MATVETLRRTPLYETHVSSGAKIVPFAGWQMPVQFASILAEARAVRSASGLFDVSHMGRLEVTGPDAAALLDRVLSSPVSRLTSGRARYVLICNEQGGIIDDAIAYRLGPQRFMLVPNAGNAAEVEAWLRSWSKPAEQAHIEVLTEKLAMIALQGPGSQLLLSRLTSLDLPSLRLFRTVEADIAGATAIVARTGYTGEDGFELMLPSEETPRIWDLLTDAGAAPCGLGARDVLRLEAGLPLHGNDIDADVSPFEAGLDRFVDFDREGYVAREALAKLQSEGPGRMLAGFEMVGRGIPRPGFSITSGGQRIGSVTRGSFSPTFDRALGMGYVRNDFWEPDTRLNIEVRGRLVEAVVVQLPFYAERQVPVLAPIGQLRIDEGALPRSTGRNH